MSTDRELLELAAKAYWGAEIDDVCSVEWDEDDQCIAYTHADNQDHNGNDQAFLWNPLADDGDALRLAVKLRISLVHEQEYMGGPVMETLEAITQPKSGDGFRTCMTECLNDQGADEMAATRRAIVRAAAEIGKAMP